ncbi:xylulose kinase [Drosophila nasuta]|uniref:xylulose kinase n=1 Tax=Drosophila nasuta TaxID=42062 RepID=UPI00295E401C|nr:xylulose kinase [Drosophila nasuta]
MCHRLSKDYSKNSYLGLYMGLERLEAIVINSDLEVTFRAVVRYDVDLPEYRTTNGISQDAATNEFMANPVMYIKALDILFNCLESQGAELHRVAAIGGAAHHYGAVFWTDLGFRRLCGLNPMFRLHEQFTDDTFEMVSSPSWVDRASIPQCYDMEDDVGGVAAMVRITGSKCFGRLTGPLIRRVYEESPEQYERTVRISLMSSFLASLLVGNIGSIEFSDGSSMNLLDLNEKAWSEECLEACAPNLKQRLMQPIASNRLQGRIADYFVSRWNFRPDCMIVSTTGSSASMVAGLNLEENVLVLFLSQADKMLIHCKQRPQLEDASIICHPVNIDEYIGLILIRNGCLVREAVCREIANGKWRLFNEMLASTPKGNAGNIEVRLDKMECTPEARGRLRWNSEINEMSDQALRGLENFEDLKYNARAVIEGQIMHRRVLATDAGIKLESITKIIALGRCTRNQHVLQIVADVFNTPVYIQEGPSPTLLGAAFRARYAFYEYREANCSCSRCNACWGSQPKLSYAEFFKHLPEELKLIAEPSPDVEAIYGPLTDRIRSMLRMLAARTSINEKLIKYK